MSYDYEEMFGPVAGQGAQATVYAKGEYAVKLYREGYPKTNVFTEAFIMALLEQENFPSPRVCEVLFVHGRYGLRMDRVKGKAMSDGWQDNPEKYKELMNVLVELQCRLQKDVNVGMWVSNLKARFRADLVCSDRLSPGLKDRLLSELDKLPDGNAFCHCDFHADNIFFDGVQYTIIDLLQISRGEPAADAACSYVSYYFFSREIAEFYLERYCEVAGVPREDVFRWLPVYAGTLLGKVPENLTPIIERFIHSDAGAE